ncbi:PEP-CTERM sorting domain-containing protein [Alteromonas sp. BZK5]|uniref:PEP-CTERM sorting domain-containing protein n=1 Tax=Alteromonas sp. BZK5 TaxID=1904459 RepID=UPI001653A72A|nr:PEP-CTERM sorting domain-containing protein [Alteromonas sp. BZK5]MBC6987770.1 PEP-CTERM sorting domain-containing protein [Alteromonas sp. BZK5]
MVKNWTVVILRVICIILMGTSQWVNAALIDVTYHDADGPQWTGVVDTTTDLLTIASWTEGVGGVYDYWTPQDPTSLIFQAIDLGTASNVYVSASSLTSYDVPDNWDGTIFSGWGFLSTQGKQDIAWNEGIFSGNNSRLGWGLAQTNAGLFNPTDFATENFFSFTPYSSTANRVSSIGGPNDFISIVPRVDVTTPDSTEVPEPATLTFFGLTLLAMRRFRRS